jgi:ankyrin repeat protein
MAVRNGRKDLVELLMVHNANVEAQDNDGQTPLCAAAEAEHDAEHDAVVELLLAHKAEPCP